MSYGITLYNDANQLTLSDQGITFGYIGKATFNYITQPTIAPFPGTPTRLDLNAGLSSYSITWAAEILPVVPIKSNGGTRVHSYTRSGDTWTILVHKASGTYDSNGLSIEEPTEVYVFGYPISRQSDWGIAIYNDSGILTSDLSRRPLTFNIFAKLGDHYYNGEGLNYTDNINITGIVKPGILGNPIYRITTYSNEGGRVTKNYMPSIKLLGNYLTNEFYIQNGAILTNGTGGPIVPAFTHGASTMVVLDLVNL